MHKNEDAQPTKSLPATRMSSTYADIVSADFNNVIKNVVSQIMLEQRREDTKKSTLVVHSVPEDGHDHVDLSDMLSFLRCCCDIIRHERFGQVGNIEKKLRVHPLNIELKSVGDANLILSNAKYLRNNVYYQGVNIQK